MAKVLQPYIDFTIVFSEEIFLTSKIFYIDSMITYKGQDSAMFLEV